ncbi:DUF4099 domain-containing protein [Bacteroides ovatus]|uniref:DUF4099 domain-containing protein n=1 Tax=Bacteroides ovatus TaxID=28116 RepID=UPI0039775E56
MYMNPNKPIIFKAEQLDWEKLEAVGIRRKEFEKDGNLDLLLQGAETGVTTLNLKTPVFSLTMDATLKLEVEPDGRPVIGINGIRPTEE